MDERGATAVEYGLLVALIAAVIVAIVATLGGKINTAFTTVTARSDARTREAADLRVCGLLCSTGHLAVAHPSARDQSPEA